MLDRLARNIRELGTAGTAFKLLERTAEIVSGGRCKLFWYVLVAQPVTGPAHLPARLGANIDVRQAEPGDPLFAQAPRPAFVIAERLQQGAICHVAHRADRLLGFLWLCPTRYVEDEVRCVFDLRPTEELVWDFDVWVQPDQRQGIVFAKLWAAAHAWLRERNYQWTGSRISRLNSGSLSAHRRLGARQLGQAWFLVTRQIQLMAASLPPYFHISRSPNVLPVLTLRAPETRSPVAEDDKLSNKP